MQFNTVSLTSCHISYALPMRFGQSAKVNEKLSENLMKWDILPLKLMPPVKPPLRVNK
jgi:hypothetical protein